MNDVPQNSFYLGSIEAVLGAGRTIPLGLSSCISDFLVYLSSSINKNEVTGKEEAKKFLGAL
ncbi:hypothetical protein [Endozoicomonas ascidiicola]|uniref:hypothetical protein n=1 Tax=Endozoicomonas ascidiicola TaxID=1698521 RepID=UPI000832DD7B|nr:hypothetical protein [Endozoicomonas ascidiicola]